MKINSSTNTPALDTSSLETSPDYLAFLRRDQHSRRAFLARMGAAGLGLAAVSLLNGCGGGGSGGLSGGPGGSFPLATNVVPGRNNNERVLNFALLLEILEADLYRQALNLATGQSFTEADLRNPGSLTVTRTAGGGGLGGAETEAGFAYIRDFAYVEAAHRDFLRSVLTSLGAPIIAPNPGGYTFGSTVNADIKSILLALLPLEETGVRAYLGAAPYLTSLSIAQTATAIYSTEARHSSAIHIVLGQDPGPSFMSGDNRVTPTYPHENTFEYFLTPTQVASAIQPFLKPV